MAASTVRRLLSSPMNFNRSSSNDANRRPYFGVPLTDIVRREGTNVPNLITKIASYIIEKGLDQVGIFRVNGNARVVERLRTSFDRNGDANFIDTVDVMAVAGVLKLFLRELPETLVPQELTHLFVQAQEASVRDPSGYVVGIRSLLDRLPDCSYATLKYLMAFLVLITRDERLNKMNANALATVFGPNMFRCMSGLTGLKEQGITNCVTLQFITKYDGLFLENGEISPYDSNFKMSDLRLTRSVPPAVKERKNSSKRNLLPMMLTSAEDEMDGAKSDEDDDDDDDESLGSSSPIVLDSDTSEMTNRNVRETSIPVLLSTIHDAISRAIREYIFGEVVETRSSNGDIHEDSDGSLKLSDEEDESDKDDDDDDDDDERVKPAVKNHPNKSLPGDFRKPAWRQQPEPLKAGKSPDAWNKAGNRSDDDTDSESDGDVIVNHGQKQQREAEPVVSSSLTSQRATSAPAVRPSSSNVVSKENSRQTRSDSAPRKPSTVAAKDTTNATHNNYSVREAPRPLPRVKSPLVEKQAWSLHSEPLSHEQQKGKSAIDESRSTVNKKKTTILESNDDESDGSPTGMDDINLTKFKKLTKQIHACKKKLKELEEEFEEEHGYKPTHSDRGHDKEMKNCLKDLQETRKQLNELRDAMTIEGKPIVKNPPPKETENRGKKATIPTMEETLVLLMEKLKDKRKASNRPEELSRMTKEEICEEKLCIQKALLHFETIHGRPTTSDEKELMHPLYDRYRKIKRILAKQSNSDDEADDIQPGTGNLSFISACTQSTIVPMKGTSLRTNRAQPSSPVRGQNIRTVGKDPTTVRQQKDSGQRRKANDEIAACDTFGRILDDDDTLNLNKLSVPRLMSELQKTKVEKKRLQLELHNFEETFQRENGRKIQKYDQLPLESEYRQYKQIKAKLKLLEVLLSKHQQQSK